MNINESINEHPVVSFLTNTLISLAIQIYKTKNLMTMTVDGKSAMKVIKKADSTETNTKDPLYLGGVPDGYRTRGLDTRGQLFIFLLKAILQLNLFTTCVST